MFEAMETVGRVVQADAKRGALSARDAKPLRDIRSELASKNRVLICATLVNNLATFLRC